MAFGSVDPSRTGPQYEEIYSNPYVRGFLIAPLLKALVYTFSSLLLCLVPFDAFLIIAGLWSWGKTGHPVADKWPAFCLALLMLFVTLGGAYLVCRIVANIWKLFLIIVQARASILAGAPLNQVEGPPLFYNGRVYRTLRPPGKLMVGGRIFDLDACGRRGKLLQVRKRPFSDMRARRDEDPGSGSGFVLAIPMRISFTSNGLLVRAEVRAIGTEDLRARAQVLLDRLDHVGNRMIPRAKVAYFATELRTLKEQLGLQLTAASLANARQRLSKVDWFMNMYGVR